MNIGFDAKRAYHNNTGLGNYSRTLVQSLAHFYREHDYFLFNPKKSKNHKLESKNIHEVLPQGFLNTTFSSLWRSNRIVTDLAKMKVDLYHGLSHEIPVGIDKKSIPSIVTIHDLIYKRFPKQFNPADVKIYDYKFKYACKHANHIIAISEQTKKDIINFFKIDERKISVCYQSCDPKYINKISEEEKEKIRFDLKLPQDFFLYMGSLIERKNLLGICKAMVILKQEGINIPLVVIGNGKSYKKKVEDFLKENNLSHQVIFLSSESYASAYPAFVNGECFPAIYQSAMALIYPSIFEGFGIPVLEALWSETPVITSAVSCLPEAGGPNSLYVDPFSETEIALAMKKIIQNIPLRDSMSKKGLEYAATFTQEKCATAVMNIYKKTW
jgi:glycosyltransferase involved in cell wall biosynthesis